MIVSAVHPLKKTTRKYLSKFNSTIALNVRHDTYKAMKKTEIKSKANIQ